MAKSKKDYDLLDSDLSIRLINQAILVKTFVDELVKIKQGEDIDRAIEKYTNIKNNLVRMSKDIKFYTTVMDDKEDYFQKIQTILENNDSD